MHSARFCTNPKGVVQLKEREKKSTSRPEYNSGTRKANFSGGRL